MKKTLLLSILCASLLNLAAQVKIGDNPGTLYSRSLLELESTDRGLLLPRLNTSQMNLLGISAPDGMFIYNTDNKALYIMRNSQFVRLADTTRTISFPYSAIVNSATDGFNLSNNGTGRAIVGNAISNTGITGLSNTGIGGYFSSSQAEALITGTGNVGLGTPTPAFQLDVNGRVRIMHNGNTAGIWYNKSTNLPATFAGQVNDTIFGLYDASGGWKMAYDMLNTRMGIGTLSPQYPLVFANTGGDKISFYGGSASPTTDHYGMGIQSGLLQLFTPSNADIVVGTGRSAAFTENVRFTGNGRVGVGTNTPAATLHVLRGTASDGTARFDGTANSSHFNYGTTEDTYIRGGKADSKVIINDASIGNIGLFTSTPAYPVTLLKSGSGFVQTDGTTEVGTYAAAGVGYIQTYSNHPLAFTTGNGTAKMTLATSGNFGIGTATPTQKLDISKGRMRFSGFVSAGNPSGIEFTNSNGTILKSFLGQQDDNTLGFYGFAGAGWGFNFNNATGNVGIGTNPGTARLLVNGGAGTALELNGAIKVSGNKPAFVLVCDASNLTDSYNPPTNYIPGNNFHGVYINNALSNGDPTAIILVTEINHTYPFGITYDTNAAMWKIIVEPAGVDETSCYGLANPKPNCTSYVSVMPYSPNTLHSGDKFNVMIFKQ